MMAEDSVEQPEKKTARHSPVPSTKGPVRCWRLIWGRVHEGLEDVVFRV